MMRVVCFLFTSILLLFGCSGRETDQVKPGLETQKQILVFYKTAGYFHPSIPVGIAAIQKLGKENNFKVDTTNNSTRFRSDSLEKYRAVIFLSTTGNILNDNQQTAFENYIRAGNGFVGIHAATDTEYDWPWYNQLVGAYFNGHPHIQPATIRVTDKNHPATRNLPDTWQRTDEWYNFKDINPAINILATLDEQSYTGGTNGPNHPISWYHNFDGGRAFYTAGGHTDESYSEPLFLQHILGGIQYAIGN